MRTTRCPAVTITAPGVKDQCTILVTEGHTHGGLHRWSLEDQGQAQALEVKATRTVPDVVLTLGVYALTLFFIAFLIAWFTR